jgi:pseudouridine kinase
LAALGNTVGLSSRVGADREGVELLDYLTRLGITAVSIQTDNTHATARYTAVLDHTSNLILGLADMGIYDDFKPAHWQQGRQEIKHWDYWCVDTNLPVDTLHYLASEKAAQMLFAVVTSPAKAHRLRQLLPTLDAIFVNRAEAGILVNSNTGAPQTIEEQARALCDLGALRAIVTAGADGAAWACPDSFGHIDCPTINPQSVSGAGDVLAGTTIAALLSGETLEQALTYGTCAAALGTLSDMNDPQLSWSMIKDKLAHNDA